MLCVFHGKFPVYLEYSRFHGLNALLIWIFNFYPFSSLAPAYTDYVHGLVARASDMLVRTNFLIKNNAIRNICKALNNTTTYLQNLSLPPRHRAIRAVTPSAWICFREHGSRVLTKIFIFIDWRRADCIDITPTQSKLSNHLRSSTPEWTANSLLTTNVDNNKVCDTAHHKHHLEPGRRGKRPHRIENWRKNRGPRSDYTMKMMETTPEYFRKGGRGGDVKMAKVEYSNSVNCSTIILALAIAWRGAEARWITDRLQRYKEFMVIRLNSDVVQKKHSIDYWCHGFWWLVVMLNDLVAIRMQLT